MGRRGPPPKPTRLKLLQGNPGRRPLPKDEPAPEEGAPDAPTHLSAAALAVWPALVAQLSQMRVLTKADGAALERLCECYGELVGAQEVLAEEGRYRRTRTQQGEEVIRPHPAVKVLQDADRRLRGWLSEFGLTPSSRVRVKVTGAKPSQTPAAKFFA